MSTVLHSLRTSEIEKGISLLGLKITESELNELQIGNAISLEGRGLSEIGSVSGKLDSSACPTSLP